MPILAEELCLYPEQLLDDVAHDSEDQWYVVYTRARHEKSLARYLHINRMHFFLPLISKEQFIRRRRVCSYLPVFSGYLFYSGSSPEDVRKVAPYCVSSVLPVENQDQLHQELSSINNLLTAGVPMTIEARLSAGQRVRVKTGVFRGLEGTVVRRRSRNRLLVAVNYLQQGVSVDIEDFMVEPI